MLRQSYCALVYTLCQLLMSLQKLLKMRFQLLGEDDGALFHLLRDGCRALLDVLTGGETRLDIVPEFKLACGYLLLLPRKDVDGLLQVCGFFRARACVR
jgi:hypothetical protein